MRDEIREAAHGRRQEAEVYEIEDLRRRREKRRNPNQDGRLEAAWEHLAERVYGDDDDSPPPEDVWPC
jgi:hypothetical protein